MRFSTFQTAFCAAALALAVLCLALPAGAAPAGAAPSLSVDVHRSCAIEAGCQLQHVPDAFAHVDDNANNTVAVNMTYSSEVAPGGNTITSGLDAKYKPSPSRPLSAHGVRRRKKRSQPSPVHGADALRSNYEPKDLLLCDMTPLSLGVENSKGEFERIVERNTFVPTRKTARFQTEPGKAVFDAGIFQGERPVADQNLFLSRFHLDVAEGGDEVEVTVEIDPNDTTFTAKSSKTGKTQSISLRADETRLTEEQIDNILRENVYPSKDEFPAKPKEDDVSFATILTAAEWNDHDDWPQFQRFLARYPQHQQKWGISFSRRLRLTILDGDNSPIPDARVTLRLRPEKDDASCTDLGPLVTVTDHSGHVVFFLPPADTFAGQQAEELRHVPVFLEYASPSGSRVSHSVVINVMDDDDQEWTLTMPRKRKTTQSDSDKAKNDANKLNIEIAFVVDTTGSMEDELEFIQDELVDILGQIKRRVNNNNRAGNTNIRKYPARSRSLGSIRVGTVMYRDRGDDYVTKVHDLTTDYVALQEFIDEQSAGGGGDYPESINEALRESLKTLTWTQANPGGLSRESSLLMSEKMNEGLTVRLLFLVADAPPHFYEDETYTYLNAVEDAAEMGIKIIPVAGSGINKATELLLRSMAARTAGKYIFLTDHSGVGDAHLSPDIDQYKPETLNAILVRTIMELIGAEDGA